MAHRLLGIPELTETPAVAVVVDVMRAFTTAAHAFAGGATRIVLAESLDAARELKAANPDWLAVKDGPPAPGFDLVNSPALMAAADVAGRTLVQKTTAGTVGALAVADASLVLCASFAVAAATAAHLRASTTADTVYVVTGDDGTADEDRACAEYIARLTETETGPGTDPGTDSGTEPGTDPAPYLARARGSRAAADLAAGRRAGVHPDDVDRCTEANRFPFAMAAARENGLLVLRPVPAPEHTP